MFKRPLILSRIATAAAVAAVVALVVPAAQASRPIASFTTKGAFTFVSAPKLHPPRLRTTQSTQFRHLAPGYFMAANFKNLTYSRPMTGQSGPLMLDSHLQPVWFYPIGTNALAANLRQQTYLGKPVLTWWQGVVSSTGQVVSGEVRMVDQQYHFIGQPLQGANGWIISLHEAIISGQDAWVTSYKSIPADLSAYGGSAHGQLLDVAVQEYDLTTGNLLYTWDAFNPGATPNIPLSQSHSGPAPAHASCQPNCAPWDAYHINSIQLVGTTQFLVSMRNTWAGYLVDIQPGASNQSGGIVWTLGGKASNFKFGPNASFQWQHDVELHAGGSEVTVFDDACCGISSSGSFGKPSGPSRGLILSLDTTHHKANLLHQYLRGSNFNAAFLGNAQLLPNKNMAVGWGSQPFFSEFSSSGTRLLDAVWPTPDQSYRVYVQRWTGKPYFRPSGAVKTVKGKTTVYASWDGATQVAKWRVLGGRSTKHLTTLATKRRSGFETAIGLKGSDKVYEVEALDRKGQVLGTSAAFPKKKSSSSPGFY